MGCALVLAVSGTGVWDAAEGGDLAGNHGGHCPLLHLTAGGWGGDRGCAHPLG